MNQFLYFHKNWSLYIPKRNSSVMHSNYVIYLKISDIVQCHSNSHIHVLNLDNNILGLNMILKKVPNLQHYRNFKTIPE